MVMSRGTFGLWGNMLSGSSRIHPKHFLPEMVGKPLDLRNQVPLLDVSHAWMDHKSREDLREHCPNCVKMLKNNKTL